MDVIREIETLVTEMRGLTLAAGVPETTYDKIIEVDSDLTFEDLDSRLAFLKKVHGAEYYEVLAIWRLLPSDIWKRYEEFGESQLREQRLLKDARKKLRKVWRKRYGEKEQAPKQDVNSPCLTGE
jgi:hypothetical protein